MSSRLESLMMIPEDAIEPGVKSSWLLVFLSGVLLLAACSSTGGALDRVGSGADSVEGSGQLGVQLGVREERSLADPVAPPSLPGQEILEVPFVIEFGPGLEAQGELYRVAVVGFSVSGRDTLPAAAQEPSYLWVGKPSVVGFPRSVTLPIPKGLTVAVFVGPGNGAPSSGSDHRGAFLPPMKSVGDPVRYVVDDGTHNEQRTREVSGEIERRTRDLTAEPVPGSSR